MMVEHTEILLVTCVSSVLLYRLHHSTLPYFNYCTIIFLFYLRTQGVSQYINIELKPTNLILKTLCHLHKICNRIFFCKQNFYALGLNYQ